MNGAFVDKFFDVVRGDARSRFNDDISAGRFAVPKVAIKFIRGENRFRRSYSLRHHILRYDVNSQAKSDPGSPLYPLNTSMIIS